MTYFLCDLIENVTHIINCNQLLKITFPPPLRTFLHSSSVNFVLLHTENISQQSYMLCRKLQMSSDAVFGQQQLSFCHPATRTLFFVVFMTKDILRQIFSYLPWKSNRISSHTELEISTLVGTVVLEKKHFKHVCVGSHPGHGYDINTVNILRFDGL